MLRSELCGSLAAVCRIAVIDGKDEEKEQLQDIIAGKQVAAQSNVLLPAVELLLIGRSLSGSMILGIRIIPLQCTRDLGTEVRQAHFQMVLNAFVADIFAVRRIDRPIGSVAGRGSEHGLEGAALARVQDAAGRAVAEIFGIGGNFD